MVLRQRLTADQRNLMTLSGTGTSLSVSPKLVARFRVVMELYDNESGDIVREEVINRGSKKFFADYWNGWSSQATSAASPSPTIEGG
jgi:hypothetical protein